MTSGRAFSTFGPRYSNICASLLLTRTHTPSTITIWTQTATFYTAPPTQVPPAKPVPSLTCAEAHELLQNTPHLLHLLILTRAQQTGARIRLCSTHDPLAIGTIIEPSPATPKKAATISTLHPPAITLRSNITLISIASNRGLAPTLFFKDLFALVARHALPPSSPPPPSSTSHLLCQQAVTSVPQSQSSSPCVTRPLLWNRGMQFYPLWAKRCGTYRSHVIPD